MKNIRLMALLSLAALSTVCPLSQAQTPAPNATPHIDQREAHQQARIAQGASSGSLTAKETQHLEREQGRINQAEAKAKSDGTVSAKERRKLTLMQDKASQDIRRDKHNRRAVAAPKAG